MRRSFCHSNKTKIMLGLVLSETNMASNASDVEISSSLDQDEEPLAELTDEELHMLVEENT